MGYNRGPVAKKIDVVVDIETVIESVTDADVEQFMLDYEPPANYKTPEVILRHREKTQVEAVQKIAQERRFSIDGKRMICAGLGIASGGEVLKIQSWGSDDLSVITEGVVKYLNDLDGDYRLIGWNHINFDIPELIKSFFKTGVRPQRKPSKWDMIDLCYKPFFKTSLKAAARGFGLETLETTSSDIGRLHAEGDWDTIRKYNEHDIYLTGMIYNAATSLMDF